MSGSNIATLIPLLSRLPSSLSNLLDFRSLSLLVDLFTAIQPSLSWYQDLPNLGAPSTLSSNIQHFLAAAVGIPFQSFPSLWSVLGGWLWPTCMSHSRGVQVSKEVLEAFRQHGVQRDIVAFNFCPPRYTCIRPECNYTSGREAGSPRVLGRSRSVCAVYFTREHGPVPAKSHSLKCDHCNSRYCYDHFVDAVTNTRTYYGGIPSAILVTTHVILETVLCIRFTWSTVCAWVSFTNNARIYNLEHRDTIEQFPVGYDSVHRPELTPTLLSDVFFLFALLRDRAERNLCLVHDSHGDQSVCLDSLLEDRTLAWVGPGRDNWNHVCDKCRVCKVIDGQRYSMRAVVTDEITIGRPCCSVHDCQNPLPSQRARFCHVHSDLNGQCVVVGCQQRTTPDHQTCIDPSHRALEDSNGRSALFVLRRRLERLRTSALDDNGAGLTEELTDYNADGECPSKSDEGNSKPRARFGRR
ncbi:hypothetical protein V8D89_006937 [Ganoderma adspersum]